MKKIYFALLAALWMGVATASAQSTGAYDATYDVNGDGKCNSSDVAVLVHWLVTNKGAYDATYDVNKDLVCDAKDVKDLVTYLLNKDTHECVDLGLPSGTLWATCNVGASSPEDYGDLFAWGETTPQSSNSYDWTTYKWMTPGQTWAPYCTKYTFADGLTDDSDEACWYSGGTYVGTTVDGVTYTNLSELLLEDDAANANWGGDWHMPSYDQLLELTNSSYTTMAWTTQNGVYGCKVTSKSNGNSIFLPAAGYNAMGELTYEGQACIYWSSELTEISAFAALFYFDMEGDYEISYTLRCAGLSVRPVKGEVVGPRAHGHEYVDLGITDDSGNPVYFATMNVGASSAMDYGDYFSWGETSGYYEGKTTFDWSTYTLCRGTKNTMKKYCTYGTYGEIDNKTTLELTDDAAHCLWGGDWRMPTADELTKLRDECTWTWIDLYDVSGYEVTGKNGNSIFLPAGGFRSNGSLLYAGSQGHYWSSSLNTIYSDFACELSFAENKATGYSVERYFGQNIRPVLVETSKPEPTPTVDNLLPGKFSVSATKQVQFTRSNLYWDGSDFKFEANQTDSPTKWETNHVAHFYWTADSYTESFGYDDCTTSDKFFADGSDADHMLTVEGTSDLYVLSSAEWAYLINSRNSGLYKYGVTVTNDGTSYTNCLIIAPDDFTGTLQSDYTLDEVNAAGLVCLPAAGINDGSISGVGYAGFYWSSTLSSNKYGAGHLFFESGVSPDYETSRVNRCSIRLVK